MKYKIIYYTSGKVRIDFYSYDDLNKAIERMKYLKQIQKNFWQYSIIIEIDNKSIF